MPRIVGKDPRYRNNDVFVEAIGRQILHDMIVVQRMTPYRAGQELGFGSSSIRYLIDRYGIEIPERWEESWATCGRDRLILRELALRYPDLKREERCRVAKQLAQDYCEEDWRYEASPLQDPENALTIRRYRFSPDGEFCYTLLTWAEAWRTMRHARTRTPALEAFL